MKISKKETAGKLLTTVLAILVISSLTLFSSCVATVQTPHHHRTAIFYKHDNGNHYGQQKQGNSKNQGNSKKHGKNDKD